MVTVSLQTVSQNVNALVTGLGKVQTEIMHSEKVSVSGDHFVKVMKVLRHFDSRMQAD